VPVIESTLAFVLVFAILVIVHELGHYSAARFFKMPIEEFAVGWGPKVAVFLRRGITEYTIRALPLGGFVRVRGMEVDESGDSSQPTGDGFNKRPVFERFMVILAGPLFSLLLGYVAYVALFMAYGSPSGRPKIVEVTPGKPAARAGLKAGDVIVAIDGKPLTPLAMVQTIEKSPGKTLGFTVERSGKELVFGIVPEAVEGSGASVGRIGVRPGNEMVPASAGDAVREAGAATIDYFTSLGRIVGSGKAKDAVGGPVGIARTFYQTSGTGISTRLELMASLSLSLFLFNILPIPVLDGGHMLLLTVEGIRRRKLSSIAMHRVHLAGLAVIATLFVVVMFNDITRWIGLR
jgi:regulator of sigma E protease